MFDDNPMCACGCGKRVRLPRHCYIHGHHRRGKKSSPEHVAKIAASNRGKKRTEEQNRRNSESHRGQSSPMKGKHLSTETRRKISESLKGRIIPDDVREKISQANRGRIFSEESRKRMSDSAKKRGISDETRKKISEALKGRQSPMKGRRHSKESKAKMGRAGKALSAETKERMSRSRMGHPVSDETRRLISERTRGRRSSMKGKTHSRDTREKMRMSALKRISNQAFNGEPVMPCVGFDERDFLDRVEVLIGHTVKRQYPVCGYFLDGYINDLNLAIEFDEKKHRKRAVVRRDSLRQHEIVERLGCRVLRVDESEWENEPEMVMAQLRVMAA